MAGYALNLFNVKDANEYRVDARGAEKSLSRHGGKVISLGDLASAPQGDLA